VISSRVYGNAEQVQDRINGCLFQFGDVGSLQCLLERLTGVPAELLSLRGKMPGTRTFEQVDRETPHVYQAVL